MKRAFSQLSNAEVKQKNIEAYIYTEVETVKDPETGKPHLRTDFFYTDLARVSRPIILDEDDKTRPMFNIIHLGGGMAQGELYRTDLVVDDNSSAIFTTQSSGKILSCDPGVPPTTYDMNIQVGDNAMMEFVNDSIILFDHTRYVQTTNLYVTPSSTAIYTEIIGSGWSETGKDHTYDLMHLRTNVYCNDEIILFDNLIFEPEKTNPDNVGLLDKYRRCGTGLFICPKLNQEEVENIRKMVREEFPNLDNHYELGISSLRIPSVVVRVLADEIFDIQKILNAIHKYVRGLMGLEALNLRKP